MRLRGSVHGHSGRYVKSHVRVRYMLKIHDIVQPQSRQPSDVLLSEISAAPVYTDSMSPFETYDDFNSIDDAPAEESMRVRYEDPGQQNEKKRLMNLLKKSTISQGSTASGESEEKGGKATRSRRSTRIAGF